MSLARQTLALLACACALALTGCGAPRSQTVTTVVHTVVAKPTTSQPDPDGRRTPTESATPIVFRKPTTEQSSTAPAPTTTAPKPVPTPTQPAVKTRAVALAPGVTVHVPVTWKMEKQVHKDGMHAMRIMHTLSGSEFTIILGEQTLKNGPETLCGTMNRDSMEGWRVDKEIKAIEAARDRNGVATTTCGFTGTHIETKLDRDVVLTVSQRKAPGKSEQVAYAKAFFPIKPEKGNKADLDQSGIDAGRMMQETIDQLPKLP